MFIVTGGAGFIGSNLVKELNRRGHTDILVVDDLGAGAKFRNLADLAIADYMDKREFRARVEGGKLGFTPAAILHNGARTDTLETDGHFMMENNFGDSKVLLHWALLHKVPMVYASSAEIYGANRDFATEPRNEKPMSVYGYAKLLFDQHVRSLMPHVETPLVGLRLFSVYGAREAHKGAMMSIPHQFLDQLRSSGACSIFGGCNGFADGEQARDFVFVGDIVDLSLHFALGGMAKGIFNAGTGEATTFNAVAQALIRQLGQGRIEYIPFPEALKGLYQSYTRADLRTLRAAGYTRAFTPLEAGIAKLVEEA